MNYSRLAILLAGSSLSWLATAEVGVAAEAAAAAAQPSALQEVVVTARRNTESMQKVPVAVSVLSPATIASKGVYSVQDLARDVPGLNVIGTGPAANRDEVVFEIRGQGFASFTLFPAVINYFNEVPIAHQITGQFFDLNNVEVLRGPQGVLFGRVTDGGNIMVSPKLPTNSFEGNVSVKVGDYGLNAFDGALNIPLVDDKVLLRGAFEVTRRDGYTLNLANGEKLDNLRYETFRVGLTLRPVSNLTNTTVVQFENLHNNGTGLIETGLNPVAVASSYAGVLPLVSNQATPTYALTPVGVAGNIMPWAPGLQPLTAANIVAQFQAELALQRQLGARAMYLPTAAFDKQRTLYVTNTTQADITPDLHVKNVFGFTDTYQDEASNYAGYGGDVINVCHSTCRYGGGFPLFAQRQLSEELRVFGTAFNSLTWSLGTYFDQQEPSQPYENNTINASVLIRVTDQIVKTTSKAVFGQAEWQTPFLPGLKINGGVRYTADSVNSRQITYVSPVPGNANLVPSLIAAYQGAFHYTPAQAAIAAAETVAPVPHGQCVPYANSPLRTFFGADCLASDGSFSAVTWTGGASYQIDPRRLVYGKVSRGYRPGGVNATNIDVAHETYKPEYDLSIELGLKADWHWSGVEARTNVALFRDRYTDIQKNVNNTVNNVLVSEVQNISKATIQGIEFEGTLIPLPGLVLGLNYAYTDAHYDKDIPRFSPPGSPLFGHNPCDPTAVSIIGFCPYNDFPFTPKNTGKVSVHYTLPLASEVGQVTLGGDVQYQGKQSIYETDSLNPDAIERAYTLVNLDATWHQIFGQPVDASFFMTNVTNRLYRVGTTTLVQRSSIGTAASYYGAPRMFGFQLTYRFGAAAR